MWNLSDRFKNSQRKLWRDQLLATAPEANPHEFVRRFLFAKADAPVPLTGRSAANGKRLQTSSSGL
jgi:hypothetical protein